MQTQKHNLKINQKKKKKTQAIYHLGCVGEEDERRRRSERCGGTESGEEGGAERSHLTHLFFLSLPLPPFLITKRAR